MVVGWIYGMYLLNFNRAAGVPLNAILYIIVTPELTRSPLKTLHSPTYQTSQPKNQNSLLLQMKGRVGYVICGWVWTGPKRAPVTGSWR